MRIIFAGTPEFAATSLDALLGSEHEIIAVYTQPDRPAGRGRKLRPSPVKVLAEKNNIPVYQPSTLKSEEAVEQLESLQADIMVVVAYGLILPANVLNVPKLGCVNIHGSLLPRWRGAAPIQRAITAGDSQTGITIIQMDAGLDTGDMLHKISCDIESTETGSSLHDKLAQLGAQAILAALDKIAKNVVEPEKQDDSLTCYANKLSKDESWLDWHDKAINLERKIRAFNAWPVARTYWSGQMIMIWQSALLSDVSSSSVELGTIVAVSEEGIDVATGEGALRLLRLQFPGGKPLAVNDIIKSKSISVGDVLGVQDSGTEHAG